MNFSTTAKFIGLNSAVAAQVIRQATRLSVEQSAAIVLEEAEALVPVDTGELRESGHVEIVSDTKAAVIFDSPHAAFAEFGTGIRGASSPNAGDGPYDPNWPGMEPRSFIRPALDTAQPAIREVFRDNVAAATRLLGKS